METPIDLLGLTCAGFIAATDLPPGRSGELRKAYAAAFREGRVPDGVGSTVPPLFEISLLGTVRVAEEPGPWGAAAKAVLEARDGVRIECALVPSPRSAALCLSSQAGCRMGCAFCETGRGGLVRHLTAAEIVSQVVTARVSLGWSFDRLVFMGMGEPLDNFEALETALAVLLDPAGAAFAQERITVCTAGLPDGIRRLRTLGYRRLGLSFSLNAPDDATRAGLMPVTRAYPLDEVIAALAAYPMRRNFVLAVNYCLLPGLNDGPGAAAGVARFVSRLGRAVVNVIPYNPGSVPITRAPTDDEVDAFMAALRGEGLDARLRVPRGRSVMAACGQLGGPAGDQSDACPVPVHHP